MHYHFCRGWISPTLLHLRSRDWLGLPSKRAAVEREATRGEVTSLVAQKEEQHDLSITDVDPASQLLYPADVKARRYCRPTQP